MRISLTELKTNPGKYIDLAEDRDVYITRNGKCVARLSGMQANRQEAARALFGILPAEVDLAAARRERLE
jgi:prevent-host-death family protein